MCLENLFRGENSNSPHPTMISNQIIRLNHLRASNLMFNKPLPVLKKFNQILPPIRRSFQKRLLCTNSNNTKVNRSIPPFLVRVGIVTTTVGLTTPLFVLTGLVGIWYRVAPKTLIGRLAKGTIGIVVGGGIVKVSYTYLIPFLANHSDFILPFAVSNAIACGFWYSLADVTLGIDRLITNNEFLKAATNVFQKTGSVISQDVEELASKVVNRASFSQIFRRLPLIGVSIGALTAITSPFLWPIAFDMCWSNEMKQFFLGDDPLWPVDLYSYIVLPIGIPVGMLAGGFIQLALNNMVVASNTTWKHRGLPVFACLLAGCGAYFTFYKPIVDDMLWIERVSIDGQKYSFNPRIDAISNNKNSIRNCTSDIENPAIGPLNYSMNAYLSRSMIHSLHLLRSPIKYFNKFFGFDSETNMLSDLHNTIHNTNNDGSTHIDKTQSHIENRDGGNSRMRKLMQKMNSKTKRQEVSSIFPKIANFTTNPVTILNISEYSILYHYIDIYIQLKNIQQLASASNQHFQSPDPSNVREKQEMANILYEEYLELLTYCMNYLGIYQQNESIIKPNKTILKPNKTLENNIALPIYAPVDNFIEIMDQLIQLHDLKQHIVDKNNENQKSNIETLINKYLKNLYDILNIPKITTLSDSNNIHMNSGNLNVVNYYTYYYQRLFFQSVNDNTISDKNQYFKTEWSNHMKQLLFENIDLFKNECISNQIEWNNKAYTIVNKENITISEVEQTLDILVTEYEKNKNKYIYKNNDYLSTIMLSVGSLAIIGLLFNLYK